MLSRELQGPLQGVFEQKIQSMVDKALQKFVTAKEYRKFTDTIQEQMTSLISDMQMKQISMKDQIDTLDKL